MSIAVWADRHDTVYIQRDERPIYQVVTTDGEVSECFTLPNGLERHGVVNTEDPA